MENVYPILVILTNKECSHCVKMRGKHGWPSSKLELTLNPLKDGSSSGQRWDEEFFKLALQAGILDSQQKARIIEVNFENMKSGSRVNEITFFDLNGDGSLCVKKYRQKDNSLNIELLKHNKNGFLETSNINTNFDKFVKTYIPLEKLRKYIHVFPSFLYVHSTIWYQAISDRNASLYARVQGFKTIRDGTDRRVYKILKEKRVNVEERDKNPIDVLRKLIAFELEPLFFPSDH